MDDLLSGLTVSAGEKREPRDKSGDTVYSRGNDAWTLKVHPWDWAINQVMAMNDLAREARSANAKRKRLIALADDPANKDDPRLGEAERAIFHLKESRNTSIAELDRLAWAFVKRTKTIKADVLDQIVRDVARGWWKSALLDVASVRDWRHQHPWRSILEERDECVREDICNDKDDPF